jgi:hypothetical protein
MPARATARDGTPVDAAPSRAVRCRRCSGWPGSSSGTERSWLDGEGVVALPGASSFLGPTAPARRPRCDRPSLIALDADRHLERQPGRRGRWLRFGYNEQRASTKMRVPARCVARPPPRHCPGGRRSGRLAGTARLADRARDRVGHCRTATKAQLARLVHEPNPRARRAVLRADPMGVDAMSEVIRSPAAGATVIFSSHQLDLGRICVRTW